MSIIRRASDTYATFRFLRILTKRWTQLKAFRYGIIDRNGKPLKKARDLKTSREKAAYTLFHRLVFKVKRMIEKLPFGKTQFASYAAAMLLLKEHCGEEEYSMIVEAINDHIGEDIRSSIMESARVTQNKSLHEGSYILTEATISVRTAEEIASEGDRVYTDGISIGDINGVSLYTGTHEDTSQTIIFTADQVKSAHEKE